MFLLQLILVNEWIDVFDVLRGMVIFGILFVNLVYFSYLDMYLFMFGKENFFIEKWFEVDFVVVVILKFFI